MVNAIGKQVFWDAKLKIDSFGFSKVSNMLENKEEGMIDTGLMMKNLVKLARQEGVEIFNGLTVNGIDTGGTNPTLLTNFGDVKARKVLVATNGFARTLLPSVGVRPCRAQVLVTSPIPGLKVQGAFHHDRGYNYFRNIDGRILLGGGRQTDMGTENTDVMETTSTIQTYLENLLSEIIIPDQNYTIDYRWSGIMGMGDSKDVIVKELNPGLFCAVRFGGMGVALGSYIGKEVSEMMAD
jgi:glycine/D-amino acid oxidase-like deaminating enzyme